MNYAVRMKPYVAAQPQCEGRMVCVVHFSLKESPVALKGEAGISAINPLMDLL
jgi:hypothetical protein